MNWWGKVIGGTFGFMLGGPLGALFGAALGNYFDGGVAAVGRGGATPGLGSTARVQTAFFTATFSIMGYIAKSDGRVSPEEIDLAQQVMNQMQLNAAQKKVAQRLFNEGKQPGFPADDVLAQFRRESFRRRNLIWMFMEIVAATAFADGKLESQERAKLAGIATALGITRQEFENLLLRLSGEARFGGGGSSAGQLEAAYALLGIRPDASDEVLKKAYRRLMSQHHPDKLVSKGLPEEMMQVAKEKTQEIKAAYELIRNHRHSG
jgi:DnaJ like chaperone protein